MTPAEVIQREVPVLILNPFVVIEPGFGVIAYALNPAVAARLAELWDRHGIADVPDDVSGL